MSMTEPIEILRRAHRVVVQDFSGEELLPALASAGFEVTLYGGPAETDVQAVGFDGGRLVFRRTGRRPDAADVMFVYRPVAELDAVVSEARRLGGATIWGQADPTGRIPDADEWRAGVEAAGLTYVAEPGLLALLVT